MPYTEELKRVVSGYAADVRRYLSGDKADYVYSPRVPAKAERLTKITQTVCGFVGRSIIMYARCPTSLRSSVSCFSKSSRIARRIRFRVSEIISKR